MCPVGRASRPRQYVQEHRGQQRTGDYFRNEFRATARQFLTAVGVLAASWEWTDGRGGGLSYAVPNPSNTRGVRRSVEGMRVQDTDGPLPGIQSDDAARRTHQGDKSGRLLVKEAHTYTQTPTCHWPPGGSDAV